MKAKAAHSRHAGSAALSSVMASKGPKGFFPDGAIADDWEQSPRFSVFTESGAPAFFKAGRSLTHGKETR